ncbi:TonB-dependent receptor [Flavihumibacter solisilvae]|uniref:TonB-dependent receptor n=1 Tax=Flavihumibacter solisilvae TaxID=1349421 RepID=A0A0C1J0Z5_9BACT|nr:TonB-dependent receptor [Flavihumibacter solisilvae]KIC96449.1 TonB-dependent receptor [Flavihumibacter solisilvae]
MKRVLVLVPGLLFLLSATAQFNVRGKVTGKDTGLPLEEATVTIKGKETHTHTGNDGRFRIKVNTLPDTLIVTHIGYDAFEFVVTDQETEFTVGLVPVPVQLSQVVVSDSRRAIRQVMQVDLKTNPVNSAQDLLRKVPGLFISQHAGGGKAEQLFLRGFDIDHGTDVRITADGLPVNMVSHAHGQGYADLHFLIPETIRDIDFGKGSYYADQGDFATAGYVNFTTLDRPEQNLFKVEGGQISSFRTVGMFNLFNRQSEENNSNAYIAGEYNYTNGPFEAPQNFNRVNLFGKYNASFGARNSISVLASSFNSKWDASGQIPDRAVKQGLISRWGAIDPTEGGNTSRTNIALKYRNRISDSEDWQTNFYYSKYDFSLFSNFTFWLNDPVNGDQIHQSESRKIYGMDNRYTKYIRGDRSEWTLTGGFGFRHDMVRDIQLSHTGQRETVYEYMARGDVDQTNISGYASADWRSGKWKVSPGLRVDHFIFNYADKLEPAYKTLAEQKTALSPKLNIVYSPTGNLQAYVKTGIGFHSNDSRVVVKNMDERTLPATYGADLGIIFRPIPELIIHPAIWHLEMQQEFVYVGDEAVVEPSGRTRRMGADLGLRYQPAKWIYLDADISYARPRAIDELKGADYIPLAPELTSTGGVSVQPFRSFTANLRYRYMKDRPANEDNSIKAEGYFVNDLLLNYSRKRWELGLQIENLFDVEWREAQFDTETRMYNEPAPVSEICYTPGVPFFARVKFSILF